MFILFCTILAGLVVWRGIIPLKLSRVWKAVLAIFAFMTAYNFIIRRIFQLENLPVPLLLTIAFLFSVQILFCGLLLIIEVLQFTYRGLYRIMKGKFPVEIPGNTLRIILFFVAMLLSIYGMISALSEPQVREYDIYLSALPRELDGMTIAHLTDIHADRITDGEKVSAIVRKTNALKADLIVLTGDIVDRRVEVAGDELKVLGDLRAPLGVFGVPGNHEYYSGYKKWMEFFQRTGIKMLENSHVVIADGQLVLGGMTDLTARKMNLEVPDVKKTFSGAPNGKMRILLAHQPKIAELADGENVALQMSGHTHGGIILGMDLIIAAFNHFMVSGEYERNGMKIFVSNGAGIWSGFPVRLGRPAEVALLHLRCKNE